jgi:hypothetical protein
MPAALVTLTFLFVWQWVEGSSPSACCLVWCVVGAGLKGGCDAL